MAFAAIKELRPPKSLFDPDRDIPDLSGRVVIVTGGNAGIGKETVKALLKKNAKVYMASRSKARATEAVTELEADTGKTALFLELDLASLASVKKAAEEFQSKEQALHILFNSGGLMAPPIEKLTADGYDLQFGTNVLGHALFTLLLVDQLEQGARTSSDGKARVVNTASNAAYGASKDGIDWDTLKDGPARRKLGPGGLYAQSKYGNWVFSCELARRFADKGIISNALNPGGVKSGLQQNAPAIALKLFGWLLYPVEYGALTQLYVGTSPETANLTGQWFAPWARHITFPGPGNEAIVGPKLWEWIQDQVKSYI